MNRRDDGRQAPQGPHHPHGYRTHQRVSVATTTRSPVVEATHGLPGASRGGRVYFRKFDHDEARARHEAGETMAAIAADYGVSYNAIWQVIRDWKSQPLAQKREFCVDCGEYCSKPIEGHEPRCIRCATAHYLATSVRADTLRCTTCRAWKPDTDFSPHTKRYARRGRHLQCRACNTAAKRAWRARVASATTAAVAAVPETDPA